MFIPVPQAKSRDDVIRDDVIRDLVRDVTLNCVTPPTQIISQGPILLLGMGGRGQQFYGLRGRELLKFQ